MAHKSKVSQYVNPQFVAFDQLGNVWKMPVYWGVREIGRGITDYAQGLRQAAQETGRKAGGAYVLETLLGRNLQEYGRQNLQALITNTFPKLHFWDLWSYGITNIDKLYTIEHKGAELPVYIKADKGSEPSPEIIQQHIGYLLDNNMSIYNYQINTDLQFFERKTQEQTLNKYSRGDYENQFVDPDRFRRWLVRDECWYVQQFGDQLQAEERDVNVRGQQYHVKVYRKPHRSILNWAYWFAGDQLYDIIDMPFDNVQRLVETGIQVAGIPRDLLETLTEFEYTGIAATRRAIFSAFSPARVVELEFDVRGPQGLARPAAGSGLPYSIQGSNVVPFRSKRTEAGLILPYSEPARRPNEERLIIDPREAALYSDKVKLKKVA
ncbi:MAG: hypothetical protein HY367_02785 [Candidatus Aenigmarchaeota archaeon]|nr:hypothetical protein [Candidatus Aenigmarchaeota archaeon]